MKTFYKSENIFIMLDGLELPMCVRFWDDGVSPSFGPITLDYAEHLIEKCTLGSPDDWNAAIDRYLVETKKYVDKFRVAAKPQCTCKNIGQAENCSIDCINEDGESYTPLRESIFPPAIAERAEEKVIEQWYLCDEDLRMESDGQLCFKQGGKYLSPKGMKYRYLDLIDELGNEHSVIDGNDGWLKHFTLITNDLRFEIEKGIEPIVANMEGVVK